MRNYDIHVVANADNTKVVCELFEEDFVKLWDAGLLINLDWDEEYHNVDLPFVKGNQASTLLKSDVNLDKVLEHKVEFISDQVELFDPNIDKELDEEETYTVFFKKDIFYAISNWDGEVRKFKLLRTIESLSQDEKEQVLFYCLGHYTGEVDLRDIFLEATYIEEIKL